MDSKNGSIRAQPPKALGAHSAPGEEAELREQELALVREEVLLLRDEAEAISLHATDLAAVLREADAAENLLGEAQRPRVEAMRRYLAAGRGTLALDDVLEQRRGAAELAFLASEQWRELIGLADGPARWRILRAVRRHLTERAKITAKWRHVLDDLRRRVYLAEIIRKDIDEARKARHAAPEDRAHARDTVRVQASPPSVPIRVSEIDRNWSLPVARAAFDPAIPRDAAPSMRWAAELAASTDEHGSEPAESLPAAAESHETLTRAAQDASDASDASDVADENVRTSGARISVAGALAPSSSPELAHADRDADVAAELEPHREEEEEQEETLVDSARFESEVPTATRTVDLAQAKRPHDDEPREDAAPASDGESAEAYAPFARDAIAQAEADDDDWVDVEEPYEADAAAVAVAVPPRASEEPAPPKRGGTMPVPSTALRAAPKADPFVLPPAPDAPALAPMPIMIVGERAASVAPKNDAEDDDDADEDEAELAPVSRAHEGTVTAVQLVPDPALLARLKELAAPAAPASVKPPAPAPRNRDAEAALDRDVDALMSKELSDPPLPKELSLAPAPAPLPSLAPVPMPPWLAIPSVLPPVIAERPVPTVPTSRLPPPAPPPAVASVPPAVLAPASFAPPPAPLPPPSITPARVSRSLAPRRTAPPRAPSLRPDALQAGPISASILAHPNTVLAANADERRRAPRFKIAEPVEVGSGGSLFYTGVLENISGNGLFVCSFDMNARRGDVYRLDFKMPDGFAVSLDAEVAWTREFSPEIPDVPPGVGLRFLELSPEAEARINAHIAREGSLLYEE